MERQVIDRAHRIGQTQSVNACRLSIKGTIEEKVVQLQQRRQFLLEGCKRTAQLI